MKYFKHIIGILFLLFIFNATQAQQGEWIEVRDFETWTSAGARLKLNKDWDFSLSQQIRLDSNSTTLDNYFTEFEAGYKLNNGLKFGLGLRYIKENDNKGKIQGIETHFRYNLDLGYKHKLGDFKMGYRVRFQNKDELQITKEQGDTAVKKVRFKIGTEYNIKNWKLDPKVSLEVFNTFGKGFDKFRFTFGTEYGLKKYGDISLFYRIEKELKPTYVEYPKTTHILGLSYVYTFKIKTK